MSKSSKKKNSLNVITYQIELDKELIAYEFTNDEKRMLRPIAETLAMLDGNAFFTMLLGDGQEWYEQYLPEAMCVFKANGGMNGWASEVSWIKELNHETPAVAEAYENYRILKALSKGKTNPE